MKSREELEMELRELGRWYQHFKLPSGLSTGDGKEPGYSPEIRWDFIRPYVPRDLSGKSVLDLGGNAGYFSIQMKLRGASRCVLVDPFVDAIRQARFAARQFNVTLELLNEDAHTFCLTTEDRFDYVIFLGLLYHLKYPGLVLDRLAEMTKERIFIQSDIVEMGGRRPETSHSPTREERALPELFFIETLYNNDSTNWWLPNQAAFAALVRSAGLKIIDQPHPHIIIAEPCQYFGKVVFPRLVFPRYGKNGAVFPGRQESEPSTLTGQEWHSHAENENRSSIEVMFRRLKRFLRNFLLVVRSKYFLLRRHRR